MNPKLITVDDYHRAAKRTLDKVAYDYFASGADDEVTLKRNTKAFKNWEVWNRVLVDVSEISTTTSILGRPHAFPIAVAPTAYHKLAHPEGESATARGAAAAGSLMIVSTLATTSIEDVARASDGPKWFQLYAHKDRGLTKSLVERAEEAGYEAIVLTVDAPVLGRRLADQRNDFALPEGIQMENLVGASAAIERDIEGSFLQVYVADRHDASLTWADLEWLRSSTSLPLVIKGIVREDDARRAIDAGAAAIVVSNHGGRQLDGAPATIDALPRVADEIGSEAEVLMDGGIRGGVDVLKALALGARAVLVGRPVLWGLAVAGPDGVEAVLRLLQEELVTAMRLAGAPNIAAVTRDLVRPRMRGGSPANP